VDQAKLILDSVSIYGVRVVTMEMTYPLIVHNELLTHRALWKTDDMQFDEWLDFSRSSSSNRAIPSERIIQQVLDHPYVPKVFQRTSRGMIAGEPLSADEQEIARAAWLRARDSAVEECRFLARQPLAVHKQWRNRLLGPFQYITTVITGNAELWEHFFMLRDHSSAQPDLAYVSGLAHNEYRNSVPQVLNEGGWHTPYANDLDCTTEDRVKISIARCARTSYLRQNEVHLLRDDLRLYADLASAVPPHDAPSEHALTPIGPRQRVGNFVGWKPFRHARFNAA